MSAWRWPDNPVPVSIDFLKRIDTEPPGTWLCQPKKDGWRRCVERVNGAYTWRAKPGGSNSLKPMPKDLQQEFESLPWPQNFAANLEWTGTRLIESHPRHELHIFDLLALDGASLFNTGFRDRLALLRDLWSTCQGKTANVFRVPTWENPGMVDRFVEQMQDMTSEGLVVRRWVSKIEGHHSRCADNPRILKIKYREVREMKCKLA